MWYIGKKNTHNEPSRCDNVKIVFFLHTICQNSDVFRSILTIFRQLLNIKKALYKHGMILTFCWPCISVYLSQYLTKLMHKICFTISFISCLYMFRAHVLIIRRSKLHSLWYHHTYRWPSCRTCDDTIGCVMQFWPPHDEHMCSKHVETWNKTYCETNFVHQVG